MSLIKPRRVVARFGVFVPGEITEDLLAEGAAGVGSGGRNPPV